jgi:hypothetical protein
MKRLRSALLISAIVLSSTGATLAQTSTAGGAKDMMGKHSMEGEVTSVDAKKGWVHLKTSEGTMIVHFPPTALQNVHKGDTMTVTLALKDEGPNEKKK